MRTLYLCGAGNPAGVRLAIRVNDAEQRWDRIAILDDDPALHGTSVLGCTIEGGFDALARANPERDHVANLVAGKTASRWKVREKLASFGLPFARLVHPSVDTLGVTFGGDDVTVYDGAVLGACAFVGEACIVFMNAVLGHRAHMAPCSIMGPGSVLNARVRLGARSYFGTNASILPDMTIGSDATIGANSSVVSDVPDNATAVGVPAQVIVPGAVADAPARAQAADAPLYEELVERVTEIWRRSLKLDVVEPDDNFFDVGGTSLLAIQITKAINDGSPIALQVTDIFRYPTIAALAAAFSAGPASAGKGGAARKRADLRRQALQSRRRCT